MSASTTTLCEFRLESIFILGDDEYLDGLAAWLDALFEAEWVLDGAIRHQSHGGWWCLCLYRDVKHRRTAQPASR